MRLPAVERCRSVRSPSEMISMKLLRAAKEETSASTTMITMIASMSTCQEPDGRFEDLAILTKLTLWRRCQGKVYSK